MNVDVRGQEMWAVFRMHKYAYRVAYLPSDSKESAPTFENWEEGDAWRVLEVNISPARRAHLPIARIGYIWSALMRCSG